MHGVVLKYTSLILLFYCCQVEEKLKESSNSLKFHKDRVRELEDKLASMEKVCSCVLLFPFLIYESYYYQCSITFTVGFFPLFV